MAPLTSSSIRHQRKRGSFIALWAKSPMKMGAILPSSRKLSQAMAHVAILNATDGMIVELGAGTGMVTHALLETGIKAEKLVVVEREFPLLDILREQFPNLSIVQADAVFLDSMLRERHIEEVEVLVSSLPLLTMPRGVREQVEAQMVKAIGKEGVIVQFTYGSKSPIPKIRWQDHRIYGQRITRVYTNIPPANVWAYRPDRRKEPRD